MGKGNYRSNSSNRNSNSNRSNSNRNSGNDKDYVKHSGCSYGQDRNGNPYVRGWKYDKRNGMRSFLAVPYSGTKSVTSKEGVEWHNWMVKISAEGRKPEIVSGLYNPATKRVIVPDLGYVMNPKGGKGGYTGPFYYRD